jgi:hypothetical protein
LAINGWNHFSGRTSGLGVGFFGLLFQKKKKKKKKEKNNPVSYR